MITDRCRLFGSRQSQPGCTVLRYKNLPDVRQQPKFVLYFGRAVPASWLLWPKVMVADNALAAFDSIPARIEEAGAENIQSLEQLVWVVIEAGVVEDIQVIRKDRLLSRQKWQFGDRVENVAFWGGQNEILQPDYSSARCRARSRHGGPKGHMSSISGYGSSLRLSAVPSETCFYVVMVRGICLATICLVYVVSEREPQTISSAWQVQSKRYEPHLQGTTACFSIAG